MSSGYEHESFDALVMLVEIKRAALKSDDADTGRINMREEELEPFRGAIAQELNRMAFYLLMKNDGSLNSEFFDKIKEECAPYLVHATRSISTH